MSLRVKRIFLALILSPIAAGLVVLLFALLEPVLFPDLDYPVQLWLLVAVLAVVIAYLGAVIIGLPAHLLLIKFNKATVSSYIVIGILVGAVPSIGTLLYEPPRERILYAALFIACSVAVSWLYGIILTRNIINNEMDGHNAT